MSKQRCVTRPHFAPSNRRGFLKARAPPRRLTIGFEWAGTGRRALADTRWPRRTTSRLMRSCASRRTTASRSSPSIVEMGQGAYTGIATVVAEELDADWPHVRVESAPADAKRYANLAFGTMQGTGGSSAMANSWMQLREAGAKARAMLRCRSRSAMARAGGELTTSTASSITRRQAPGDLRLAGRRASALPVPDNGHAQVRRRTSSSSAITLPRVDVPAKIQRHGAVHARRVIARHAGGVAAAAAALRRDGQVVRCRPRPSAVPGVVQVVQVPRGVAVIAKSFWAAKQGRDALKVEWDDTQGREAQLGRHHGRVPAARRAARRSARKDGDAAAGAQGAAKNVSATYEFPYLAHAPMEPLDAVVKLTADSCEIWAGDQFQTVDQGNAAHDRRARSAAGEHPHAVCGRQLRPARQHGVGLHRRGGLDRQGAGRRRHADQAAVDARGRHPRRPLSADVLPQARSGA